MTMKIIWHLSIIWLFLVVSSVHLLTENEDTEDAVDDVDDDLIYYAMQPPALTHNTRNILIKSFGISQYFMDQSESVTFASSWSDAIIFSLEHASSLSQFFFITSHLFMLFQFVFFMHSCKCLQMLFFRIASFQTLSFQLVNLLLGYNSNIWI